MDKDQFLKAFTDFNVAIYNFVFFNVGRQKELAEDITQETFLKGWQYIDSYDSKKASFKTWLYSIAHNLVIDFYKKQKFTNLEEGFDIVAIDDQQVDVERELMLTEVLHAMDQLSTNDKSLIAMRYIQGLEFSEISKVINKTYTATKVALHRALKNLQYCIKYGKKQTK